VDLRKFLAALRTAWWMPLVGALVGGLIGVGFSSAQTPVYASTTQLFVSTTDSGSTSEIAEGNRFSQERLASYAQLLIGPRLASRVMEQLSLDMTPQDLSKKIVATPVPETVLIDVTVTDPSPEAAQRIATAVAAEFRTIAVEYESRGSTEATPVEIFVAADADLPTSPTAPKTIRNTAVALVLGLLLGTGAAIGRARLDRSVKDPDLAAELAGAPAIGMVAVDKSLQAAPVGEGRGSARASEDFRRIRTNLQFLSVDQPPQVVMVTSALPEEGKSTLTANLALMLAEAGRTVTVIEADLRRPRLAKYLGMVGGAGLTNVLSGTADLDDVLQPYGDDGLLSVIAAGPTPPNPGELLGSSNMATLLEKLAARNDFVLLDAAPLLPVADSTSLAVHTDGAILAVRYGKTRMDQLEQAVTALERSGSKALGLVLNFVPPKADIAAAYGYGYAYDRAGEVTG
jgi:capsular exopolysaccharide synthesis family protein